MKISSFLLIFSCINESLKRRTTTPCSSRLARCKVDADGN